MPLRLQAKRTGTGTGRGLPKSTATGPATHAPACPQALPALTVGYDFLRSNQSARGVLAGRFQPSSPLIYIMVLLSRYAIRMCQQYRGCASQDSCRRRSSEIILGKLSPKSYLILELATNTLGIFKENWMKIAKIILEKY
jgi:hypothetical protein